MTKILESYTNTDNDSSSLKVLQYYIDRYPTEKGYRIEIFMSPKFVRVTIYKERG